ncbi:MAG: sigma 54-interacting transcriptional regulator [Sandaracinaceae bacterium]
MGTDDTTQNQRESLRGHALGPLRTSLVVYHGERVRVVPLDEGASLVLGRAEPADLVIDDKNLSRKHARFTHTDEGVRVEDLDSTNGTYFGGARLANPALLQPGDAVTLGAITVSVNRSSERAGRFTGIESYERFVERVADEVVRSRTFLRGAAVLMLRRLSADETQAWVPRICQRLRPVDRVALYGTGSALIVLPETDRARAMLVATNLIADDAQLVAGVAVGGASAAELIDAARTLARRADARQRVIVDRNDAAASTGVPLFVSPKMIVLGELIDRVAQAKIPVLVQGETGCGKEVVARAIHERGPRAKGPLRAVNCGAMPANLLEDILFGHEKGAFTGADRMTPGLFEQADGGTLFLDEVAELTPAAQAALLRVLESQTLRRVGGVEDVAIDVRVIVATHRDLDAMVAAGEFREDLLFRVNPMTIEIPPLRERVEDLAPLIERFLREACEQTGASVTGLDDEASQLLRAYRWPGNVRELRNVIDRAVVVCRTDRITSADLPPRMRDEAVSLTAPVEPDEEEDFKDRVRSYETKLILDALRRTDGNQTEAARLLRIPVRTLVYKLRAFGIRHPQDD